ncbi:MAG: molybdopterin molybdotransferase MoeA [Chthoniobacterales bacterium]
MKSLITPSRAEALILPLRKPFPAEPWDLERAAGRILRQEIKADHDFPPFDRVTMDGVAVRAAEIRSGRRRFCIRGMAAAGERGAVLPSEEGAAMEVMTGAIRPDGADCILPCEWYRLEGGILTLTEEASPQAGVFIHARGSDHRAGEVLLRPGICLGPVAISIAAACGCDRPMVSALPRVAVIGTGDELVLVGEKPGPGQIRRTNIAALSSALELAGYPPSETGCLRDDPQSLRTALEGVLSRNDVVVLTGGVSKGKRDHVPEIVRQLGALPVLHGIAQRPGKPMAVWNMTDGPVIFGLPGNPVSALVCLHRYLLPALGYWSGAVPVATPRMKLSGGFVRPPGLTLFLPVVAESNGSARPLPVANSGDFAGLIGSTGFLELDETFAEGGEAPYFAWAAP